MHLYHILINWSQKFWVVYVQYRFIYEQCDYRGFHLTGFYALGGNFFSIFAMKIRMLLQKWYKNYVITTVDSAKGLTNGASFTLRPIL